MSIELKDFKVQFESEHFEKLDQLALLARQDYNLGGAGDWFGEFRGGLYGFYARLYGVQHHYSEVHAWLPRVRHVSETEYHLASIMFQMDSALECLTFAINAFGWAAMPTEFRDVTDEKTLRWISPLDVLGGSTRLPSPQPGYLSIFPSFCELWKSQSELINQIRELHDVSKHRKIIYTGGRARSDTPTGFNESLGIPEKSNNDKDSMLRTLVSPAAEIVLKSEPKIPLNKRLSQPYEQRELLENLVPSFACFINSSGAALLTDARQLDFKESQFLNEEAAPYVRNMIVW